MAKYKLAFVAFDSAKDKHAVAIAEDGRDGEVRYFGEIENSPSAVKKFVAKLSRRYDRLHCCYSVPATSGHCGDKSIAPHPEASLPTYSTT